MLLLWISYPRQFRLCFESVQIICIGYIIKISVCLPLLIFVHLFLVIALMGIGGILCENQISVHQRIDHSHNASNDDYYGNKAMQQTLKRYFVIFSHSLTQYDREWLFVPIPCRFIHWLSTVLVFPILPFPKLEDTETFGHVSFVVRKHGIQIRARITKVRPHPRHHIRRSFVHNHSLHSILHSTIHPGLRHQPD